MSFLLVGTIGATVNGTIRPLLAGPPKRSNEKETLK